MGVTNFQPYIKKVYAKACKKTFNVEYDNLYIELNHVLHRVCYLSKDTNDLLAKCRDYLNGIILTVKPKKRLILAADGAAPLAKMLLQRKRRSDSVKTLEENEFNSNKTLSLNLTPGTNFMMNLEESLEGLVEYVKNKFHIEVTCLITDSNEGEIKIKHHINKLQRKNPTDTHIVYSADSDVILILFTCDDLSKIYQIINNNTIIHFGTLYDEHIEKFGFTKNVKNDFVFINLMMGNDYLPKVASFKLEAVWDAYKLIGRNRPNGMISIDKDIAKDITLDPIFIHDLLYISCKNMTTRAKHFEISELHDDLYDKYVEGIYWCFGMYVTGKCSNYQYIYDHKKGPHITGVMLSLIYHNKIQLTSTPAIDIDLYGILLIPEKAQSLLSKEQIMISQKLVKKNPVIYEENRCDKCKNYIKHISKLNKECKLYDSDSNERFDASKRLGKLRKEYTCHKDTHETLTIDMISVISKNFLKIRETLRDTQDLGSDSGSDFNSDSGSGSESAKKHKGNKKVIELYNPNAKRENVFKKKLF